ncbi:MAG: SdpI family protein [Burkholderiales bacterium]|nr:SdpI family protein [Burkholderiales bacterium]
MFSVVFFLIAYAVIALIAIPLAMRLIPPNPIYGVRTPRTADNPEHWYNVNAVAGQLLLAACGVSAILLMMYQGTWLKSFWAQLVLFVIPIAAAVIATLYFEKKGAWK